MLGDARVQERAMVLDVGPVAVETPSPNSSAIALITDFLPRNLFALVLRRDLLFAAC